MLDKFIYTNHLGESIEFGKYPYFANASDLYDYEWEHDDDLTRFDRGTVTKALNVTIVGSKETAAEYKNKLYEVIDKDVLAMKKGTFKVGDYKMTAFINGSEKTDYLTSRNILMLTLPVVTDTPQWKSEKTFTFAPLTTGATVGGGRDYMPKRGYNYGYAVTSANSSLNNDSFYSCGFIMNIYGAAVNPAIIIGGKTYRVNVTIAANEYLQIISDGTNKTITLIKNNGEKVDCFANRYREQSVFAKIDAGIQQVSWNNEFTFDITLLKERSEPKWR